jgi:hypothetical protein
MSNVLDSIAAILHRARVDGGWSDEAVAHRVLVVLGLDENGRHIAGVAACDIAPTSSNLGHG